MKYKFKCFFCFFTIHIMVFHSICNFWRTPNKKPAHLQTTKIVNNRFVHVFISNNNSQKYFLSFKDSQIISCHSRTLSKNKHSLKKALIFKRKIVLPKVLLLPTLFSPKIEPESLKWTVLFFCERKWAQQ